MIAPNARLKLLGDRFGITEGPVWVPQGNSGYLLVSDLTANAIYRIDPDGAISVFLDNCPNDLWRGASALHKLPPVASWARTTPEGLLV
jgi:sugar lactone lactonase YvrE